MLLILKCTCSDSVGDVQTARWLYNVLSKLVFLKMSRTLIPYRTVPYHTVSYRIVPNQCQMEKIHHLLESSSSFAWFHQAKNESQVK